MLRAGVTDIQTPSVLGYSTEWNDIKYAPNSSSP